MEVMSDSRKLRRGMTPPLPPFVAVPNFTGYLHTCLSQRYSIQAGTPYPFYGRGSRTRLVDSLDDNLVSSGCNRFWPHISSVDLGFQSRGDRSHCPPPGYNQFRDGAV